MFLFGQKDQSVSGVAAWHVYWTSNLIKALEAWWIECKLNTHPLSFDGRTRALTCALRKNKVAILILARSYMSTCRTFIRSLHYFNEHRTLPAEQNIASGFFLTDYIDRWMPKEECSATQHAYPVNHWTVEELSDAVRYPFWFFITSCICKSQDGYGNHGNYFIQWIHFIYPPQIL